LIVEWFENSFSKTLNTYIQHNIQKLKKSIFFQSPAKSLYWI